MDILKLYQDYNIDYATEGHKHCRPGWVNIECPFCTGNPGLHLGFPIEGFIFRCWRCGVHYPTKVISALLHVNFKEAKKIINEYGGKSNVQPFISPVNIKKHIYPSNVTPLDKKHIKYLLSRKHDPGKISNLWGVEGTGPISSLQTNPGKFINYQHRLIIPIYWGGERVSFLARDVTEKHELKYLVCPKIREKIHHKHILYGNQFLRHPTIGIIVEGATDVWRFGVNSFATFGIEFTRQQVHMIAYMFKTIAVAYDFESQAQQKADELIAELRFRGKTAFKVPIQDDPDKMDQKEADYLVKQIII